MPSRETYGYSAKLTPYDPFPFLSMLLYAK
jgi:hypothetical protein